MLIKYHKVRLVTSELPSGESYKSDSTGHVMVKGKHDYSGLVFPRAHMSF